MSTAYENLKKHLELAIRQLKEIKETKKKFDVEELIGLESQLSSSLLSLLTPQKRHEPYNVTTHVEASLADTSVNFFLSLALLSVCHRPLGALTIFSEAHLNILAISGSARAGHLVSGV